MPIAPAPDRMRPTRSRRGPINWSAARIVGAALAASAAGWAVTANAAIQPTVDPSGRWVVDVSRVAVTRPDMVSCEIVAWSTPAGVLLATDPAGRRLTILSGAGTDPPNPRQLDFDRRPGAQGVGLPGVPTSVAAHPHAMYCLVVVRPAADAADPASTRREGSPAGASDGASAADAPMAATPNGRLLVVDLAPETRGTIVLDQPVGPAPDAITIAPDGTTAFIACEAEDDPSCVGRLDVVDLRGLDLRGPDAPPNALPLDHAAGLESMLPDVAPESIEPEFVAIADDGGLVALGLQEQDAIGLWWRDGMVLRPAAVIRLPAGAAPDGLAILADPGDARSDARDDTRSDEDEDAAEGEPDDTRDDERRPARWLLAVAEEGHDPAERADRGADAARDDPRGHVGLYRIERGTDDGLTATRLGAIDLRDDVATAPRRSPVAESVALIRAVDRPLAVVANEAWGTVSVWDVGQPARPVRLGRVSVGPRPEGLSVRARGGDHLVAVGNEGRSDREASIALVRIRLAPLARIQPPSP